MKRLFPDKKLIEYNIFGLARFPRNLESISMSYTHYLYVRQYIEVRK